MRISLIKVLSYRFVSIVLLLVVVVFLYLFYLESLKSNYFLYGDNSKYYLPSYFYSWSSVIGHKTIPLINFHQYLGQAFLAQGQSGVFYLPVYLSAFFSKLAAGNIFYTIDILVFAHLIASGIGMFFLLRRFQLLPGVCFLGSLIWITLPFVITLSRNWVFISYTAAYLPFNFLLLDRVVAEPRIKNGLYLALLKAAFFYQGYVQYVFILFLFDFIYLVTLSTHRLLPAFRLGIKLLRSEYNIVLSEYKGYLSKFLGVYLSSVFFFFCLVSPLLFPMISQQRESAFRSTKLPFGAFINHRVELVDFIATQFFYFQDDVVFGVDSEIFYFGFINFLLLSLVLFKKQRSNNKITVCIIVAGIALIFSTLFYAVFYYVPGFNLFRWPFKHYLIFLFFATIGVAGISNNLIKQNVKWIEIGTYFVLILAIALNCLVQLHKPENVTNFVRIDNPPRNYVEKYIHKDAGRVFTFRVRNARARRLYKYFTFSFATLFGYFHFGGYDPLVSELNYQLSLRLRHENVYEGRFSPALLNYLSLWSVRYLITTDDIQTGLRLSRFPQLKLKYKGNNILLYENTGSLPLVYYYGDLEEQLEYELGINEVDIYPNNNEKGTVIISVAPLPQFQIYINGVYAGRVNPKEAPIRVNIPPNTRQVTLKYVDYQFYAGTLIFILFWIGLLCFLVISVVKNSNKKLLDKREIK